MKYEILIAILPIVSAVLVAILNNWEKLNPGKGYIKDVLKLVKAMDKSSQETPMFCIYHSFCYSLICENQKAAQYLGYFRGIPQVADGMSIRKLRTMCRQQCGTKISDNKLDGKVEITKSEKFQKEIYWKQFNKLMKEQNLITFDHICYGVCDLFKSDSPLVEEYKKKFKYIFVDEFQDTDPKHMYFHIMCRKVFASRDMGNVLLRFQVI